MATIRTSMQLQDNFSPVIRGMTNAMNICISSFESMERASGHAINTDSFEAARREINNAEIAINQVEDSIRNSNQQQQQFNNSVRNGQSAADGLANKVGNIVKAYLGFQAVKGVADISDQYVQTTARLNMMNDKLQTTDELQNMIFQSAQRSRTLYSDTANAVAQLGIRAQDAFSSNSEVIAFTETLNKMFVIAGAGQQEISSATLQLTQALGSGILRGEEFNAVFEAAPNVMQAVADYIGRDIGELKNMASEGQITADVVKQAMFAAAAETNAQFETMPKTIGQIWTSIKNQALMAFQPVLLKINEIANNPNFNNMVTNIAVGMATIANITLGVIDTIANVGAFFQSNWGIIGPIIWGIVAALIAYNAVLLINNIRTGESIIAKTAHAIASGVETAAIIAMTFAQQGLNAALALCPISWIIYAIIALVAIFYAAIGAMNKFAGTSLSATGIIAGAFMVAVAVIGNAIVGFINGVIDAFVIVHNFIAVFAEFFANVFDDPIGSIIRLFSGLADTVLQILQSIASGIDTIFGSNLASAVSGWSDQLQGWTDEVAGEAKIKVERIDPTQYHLDRFDYGNAWDKGYGAGAGFEQSISNMFAMPEMPAAQDPGFNYDELLKNAELANGNLADTADNTGAIKDAMEISDEDLKYLRDIAEQEVINRFTTAEVKVDMTNHNAINSDVDLDGIIHSLGEGLYEGLQTVAEGATYDV